jgi:isoamylase
VCALARRYGYRIHGPWIPEQNLRFNPAKLLLDPYAHELSGELEYVPEIYGHQSNDEWGNGDLTIRDLRDSAGKVPFSVVSNYRPRLDQSPRSSLGTYLYL